PPPSAAPCAAATPSRGVRSSLSPSLAAVVGSSSQSTTTSSPSEGEHRRPSAPVRVGRITNSLLMAGAPSQVNRAPPLKRGLCLQHPVALQTQAWRSRQALFSNPTFTSGGHGGRRRPHPR